MEYNNNGWIALKRYQTINKVVTVGKEQYAFCTSHNICMAWVKPEHVNQVLAVQRVCCSGSKKSQFFYASETDVRRFEHGGR